MATPTFLPSVAQNKQDTHPLFKMHNMEQREGTKHDMVHTNCEQYVSVITNHSVYGDVLQCSNQMRTKPYPTSGPSTCYKFNDFTNEQRNEKMTE